MSDNLVNDVVQQIVDEKPQKSKLIIKWLIRIGIFLVGAAFTYGQIKMRNLNRLEEIEESVNKIEVETTKNTEAINSLQLNFDNKINNLKDEGYNWFIDYQRFSKNQFKLIIDYGNDNKDLLKRMIEINALEKEQEIKTKIEQSKLTPITTQRDPSIFSVSYAVNLYNKDTIYHARNATQDFMNKIEKKYKITKVSPSEYGDNLIDFVYQNY